MNEVKAPFYVEDIFVGKTFNDFSINPQKGVVKRRGEVALSSRFSRNIPLNLPVSSANMDTVTGPKMCIAIAQEGGIGILPRGEAISIKQQVDWVKEVKRAENFIIENPYSIPQNVTVGEARREMEHRRVGTLLVVQRSNRFYGMLAEEDIRVCSDDEEPIWRWMRYANQLSVLKVDTLSISEAIEELKSRKVSKLILVDESFRIKGLITSKDIASLTNNPWANKDAEGRLRVGAAIGATGDYLERTESLIEAGADVIVMDIAHGHSVV